jgi:hypothetical protein
MTLRVRLVMTVRHKIGMTLTVYINKNIKISMIEEIGKEDLWAYLSFCRRLKGN